MFAIGGKGKNNQVDQEQQVTYVFSITILKEEWGSSYLF